MISNSRAVSYILDKVVSSIHGRGCCIIWQWIVASGSILWDPSDLHSRSPWWHSCFWRHWSFYLACRSWTGRRFPRSWRSYQILFPLSPAFWIRCWKFAQMVLAECFRSKDLRKLVLTVSQLSLLTLKAARLSHQDWASSSTFDISSQVAISEAFLVFP